MPESGEKLLSETKRITAVSGPNLLRCVATWTKRSVSLPKFAEFAEQMTCAFGEGLPGFVWASGFSQWITDVTESGCCLRREIAAQEGLHAAFGCRILGDYEPENADSSQRNYL
jgi:hypothetical protein